MGLAVLSDFDGTITSVDTGVIIMSLFAKGDWRAIEAQYDRNEVPFEDAMQAQLAMLKTNKRSMIREVDKAARLRSGFKKLLTVCNNKQIPFVVVSYGLDFSIRHILKTASLENKVKVHVPKAKVTPNGTSLIFPKLLFKESVNLKDDMVRRYRQEGYEVIYIGDGTSDFPALKIADLRFAVTGSKAATLCKKDGIQFFEITDFRPVINCINSRLEEV